MSPKTQYQAINWEVLNEIAEIALDFLWSCFHITAVFAQAEMLSLIFFIIIVSIKIFG